MATTIRLVEYPGYPTATSMRYYVTMTVTYAANYKVHFKVESEYGDVVFNGFGSTISMSAGESITTADDFYKTFTGLDGGVYYTVTATLYNADTNTNLGVSDTASFTAGSSSSGGITVTYHDGTDSPITESSATTSMIALNASRDGWTFLGWATSTGTTTVKYEAGDTITGSGEIDLYAVYTASSTIRFYYIDSSTGSLDSNTRQRIQHRYNTGKRSYTISYNTITCPSFDSANSTITTTDPVRTWTALGWIIGTYAEFPDYSPGESVSTRYMDEDIYAVYSNECSITYNANGGSGSMSKQTDTGYYNASGTYEGATFKIQDCTFTPPTGKLFGSWNSKSDGSGRTYSGTLTTSYAVTLYAIWITSRPSNWSWTTTGIAKGSSMTYTQSGTTVTVKPLTAKEWLSFMDRIKAFYLYKGRTVDSTYWNRAVNGVSSGSAMTSIQANGARYLINQLSPPTSVPSAVSSGSTITAAFINGLKNSLNSIK